MASHAPQSLLFVTNNGSVAKTGFSSRIGRGQVALIDRSGTHSALGMEVLFSAPQNVGKNTKFELRYGSPNLTPSRSNTNKNWGSIPFTKNDILDIKVNVPNIGITLDDMVIAFNGLDPKSEVILKAGDTEVIDITLSGEPMGMLGYEHSRAMFKIPLFTPTDSDKKFTMQEVFEDAAKRIKEITLLGGEPITNYIDVFVVNSENVALTGAKKQVYTLEVTDEGRDTDFGLVQAQYPTFDVKRVDWSDGKTKYSILAPEETEIADFVKKNVNIADDCDDTVTTTNSTFKWVAGEIFSVVEEEYTIQLVDNPCDEKNKEALDKAYPGLTITESTSEACQGIYTTKVVSDIVEEDCDPIFRALFTTEAPKPFGLIHWEKAEKKYSPDAKMGIRLRGKQMILGGSEEFLDDVPLIYTSTRISLANEAPGYVNHSYNIGTNGRFKVKVLSIATDPEGMGKDLRDLEYRTKVYFTQEPNHYCNNFAKYVLGEESLLKPFKHYITYSIAVKRSHPSQSFSGDVTVNYNYILAAEYGRHQDVEAIVNILAGIADLPAVKAV